MDLSSDLFPIEPVDLNDKRSVSRWMADLLHDDPELAELVAEELSRLRRQLAISRNRVE